MWRWLTGLDEWAMSDTCICRGEMEVMEGRMLTSVNTISRMVGLEGDSGLGREGQEQDAALIEAEAAGPWWI